MRSDIWKRIKASRIPLFRISGIQVNLDYSWFVIFALVTWSLSAGYFPLHSDEMSSTERWMAGLVTSLLFFFSIVLHEMAHSLVALRAGLSIKAITLYIFGGASHLDTEPKTPRTEFTIAIAGPVASLTLGVLLHAARIMMAHGRASTAAAVLYFLTWINLSIGIFNLVPGFPLDGGRILRAVAWWKTGSPEYSIKLSTDMGKGFSLALMALGLVYSFTRSVIEGVWLVIIGFFLRNMAYTAMEGFSIKHALGEMTVLNAMNRNLVRVEPDVPVNRLVREYLRTHPHSEFPVEENERFIGTVSLEEIIPLTEEERKRLHVRDIMVPLSAENGITPETSLSEAFRRMKKLEISRLLVFEDGKVAGILSSKGVIRLLELRRARELMI